MELIATLYVYNPITRKLNHCNSKLINTNDDGITVEELFYKLTEDDDFTDNKRYVIVSSEFEYIRTDICFIFTDDEGKICATLNLFDIFE